MRAAAGAVSKAIRIVDLGAVAKFRALHWQENGAALFNPREEIAFSRLLREREPVEYRRLSAEVFDTFANTGFGVFQNHFIGSKVLKDTIEVTRQFFKLPVEKKQELEVMNRDQSREEIKQRGSLLFRGYAGFGVEETLKLKDCHENVDFFNDYSDRAQEFFGRSEYPLHGSNLYSQYVPMKQIVTSYFNHGKRLGFFILNLLLDGLKLTDKEKFLLQNFDDPFCMLRLMWYPSTSANALDGSFGKGIGEHTDFGCLTLLFQDDDPNGARGLLQVQDNDGQWSSVPDFPLCFIVNIGDMLQLLSDGVLKSTKHRVMRNETNKDRISIPFFFEPNYDAQFHHNGTAVKYGDYLMKALIRSYPKTKNSLSFAVPSANSV